MKSYERRVETNTQSLFLVMMGCQGQSKKRKIKEEDHEINTQYKQKRPEYAIQMKNKEETTKKHEKFCKPIQRLQTAEGENEKDL